MTYQIQIIRDYPCKDPIGDLEAVAQAVLEDENASPGGLSIVLTSSEKIRELNRRFAHIDQATDVLSFSDGSISPETERMYYGDITIALPIAEQQAKQAKHTLAAELALLSIHGVLHLLGHDHQEPEEREHMWQIQAKIMDRFGYAFEPSEHEE
jgi:probable rRNA maturation factor